MGEHAKVDAILRTGQVVAAKYRVGRLIAKGGMAAVWAGVNEHSGKRVALKVILRSFSSNGDAVELFRREALAASKVNHPNVVSIFDVIDHEGATIIVMEVLDGETFGSYLTRNGPLSLERTLVLLLPAMRGVAAANAQGVVHRDLKPDNLFLCGGADGQWITTKVLDFGVSVMMGQVRESAPATDLYSVFGTPAYMAPEAIECSRNIDGRADVYGFGVLFFEALTGKLPFPGKPGLELLRRILADAPPKVTLYRTDLPSDVVEMIDCALAKNANDRFVDMQRLIAAAQDCLLTLQPTPCARIPLAFLALTPPVERNCEVEVPVVCAEREGPPSRAQVAETRALYSPVGEPLPGLAQRMKVSPADAVKGARRKRSPGASTWRSLKRRIAIGARLIAFLMVMTWVTTPASSSDSAVGSSPSSSSSKTAGPAPGAVTPPLGSEASPAMPRSGTSRIDRKGVNTARPSTRAAAATPSKRSLRAKSARRSSRGATAARQPSTAPAGRLSAFDF